MKWLLAGHEVRVIGAFGGFALAIPLLFLSGKGDPLPALATLLGHSALLVFLAGFFTWIVLFKWLLARRSADSRIFAICGGMFGALPGVIYSAANLLGGQPMPLFTMIIIGAAVGTLCGYGVRRLHFELRRIG